MEIPGVGRRRGKISSVSLLDYPHSQPPECQLCHFPDDTSVPVNFAIWIWTNLEEGALRHPSQMITGWIAWNNLHFLLWIGPILIEPFRKCYMCFNHPVQADWKGSVINMLFSGKLFNCFFWSLYVVLHFVSICSPWSLENHKTQ